MNVKMSGLQVQVRRAVLWVLYFAQFMFVVLVLWVARAASGLRAFNAPLVLAAEAPASVAAAMAAWKPGRTWGGAGKDGA